MNVRAVRSKLLALLIAASMLLSIPVVAAGAAEMAVPGSRDGVAVGAPKPSEDRIKARALLDALDVERGAASGITPLANNDIPGDPLEAASDLPYPAILETANAAGDVWDVYSVTAYPGDQILMYADTDPGDTGTATLDVSVFIWDASATSVLDSEITGGDFGGPGEPDFACYTVPDGAPTTYYVGVHADAGSGDVDYLWSVVSRSDGNIPGVALPDSGFSDVVFGDGDMDDVYAVTLGQGELLSFELNVTSGDPVNVYMYAPGTTDVWSGSNVYFGAGTTVDFSHIPAPGAAGTYYIDVYSTSDVSEYTVDWTATGGNIPGGPLPASGAVAIPDGYTVYYKDLRAGETFDFSASDPGNDLQIWLLGRDAVDITDPTLAGDADASNPKTISYTVPEGGAGRYYILVESSGATNPTIAWGETAGVARLSGLDRYHTAALTSKRNFNEGADTVVIASGEGFADALSAAGLAGAYDAPILLTRKGVLPDYTRSEIVRLGATRCIIVGGTSVVSAAVSTALDNIAGMRTPIRIAGSDRYETSAKVADAVFTKCGWIDWVGLGVMARGDNYADALALAPLAWAAKLPVLLTKTTSVPEAIDDRINDEPDADGSPLIIMGIAIAGSESAVSAGVFNYLETGLGIDANRYAGATRYETAVEIAKWSADSPWLSYDCIGLATGLNYPDALGGGAGIGKVGGVLLMTEPTRLTPATRTLLQTNAVDTREAQVFGSVSAVNASAYNSFKALYE